MGRRCTVCDHADQAAIDERLLLGDAGPRVAGEYGLSPSAVHRHRTDHLSAALARVTAEREAAGPTRALDRLEALHHKAMSLLDTAEQEGKSGTALAAIREARSLVETIARITGELDDRTRIAVVNVQTSAEWHAIQAAMQRALAPYPAAARAVSSELLALEAAP